MTFAVLRSLHNIIGEAIDVIEGVFTKPPLDGIATPLDFPSLEKPFAPESPEEKLVSNPDASKAINRLVAAAGQLSATAQVPFLSACDATMPIRNASVFLLRCILHDWPDDHSAKILNHLREAATEHTRLLIDDFILATACVDAPAGDGKGEDELEGIEGVEKSLAPPPLLANLGKASASVYWQDMTMQCMFNSRERTLREFVQLFHSVGWKIIRVHQEPGSFFSYISAVPVDIPTPTVVEKSSAAAPTKAGSKSSTRAKATNGTQTKPGDTAQGKTATRFGTLRGLMPKSNGAGGGSRSRWLS